MRIGDAKQDCELKAFKRLAAKIKQEFPHLPLLILLDGLYPNGPVFELCLQHNWDFMIVLKNKCLPSVWEEFNAMKNSELACYQGIWHGRKQKITWVNTIDYAFKGIEEQQTVTIHMVVCYEEWKEINANTAEIETKYSRHAWISGKPLTAQNVHERCNLGARFRWGIEDSHHTEKRRGYCYEHLFSHDWQAMCGFHHLMRLAHLIQAITFGTPRVARLVRKMGLREFLTFVKESFTGLWLSKDWIAQLLAGSFQWQLE
jgi:hypothetical protein